MPTQVQRAASGEIYYHLKNLLGIAAVQVAVQVADLSRANETGAALTALKTYDATLGGIGVYVITDKRPLGVYRPLSYVEMPLHHPGAENYSRFIIQSACGYLEELLKYVVRSWPWEIIKSEGIPLGALVKRAYKYLPSDLADELVWLSSGVYNFAKHEYNLSDDFGEQEPEHYFQLEEAIAVYLIVRNLGLQLEQLIGKTPEQLMVEY